MAIAAVPYLWVLWDLWNGSVDTLRSASIAHGFYDFQARSMMQGHLNVPAGSIGPEAFLHAGKQYTYFGIFPSLLRMPIFVLTHTYDRRLTAPSMLLAWVVTGVFSALLLWRVRTIVRGSAPLGRLEATSYGVIMATILSGSVVVILAATPYVYNEDFAWSVALTVGALFAFVGVMERPGVGRVALAGLLVLCAALNRTPTGWACVIGAVLIGIWFFLGRHGADNRRWAVPMLAVGLVPLVVSSLISMAKFGSPFGFSLTNQLYTFQNAHRRYYLSTTGGKGYNLRFVPSTLLAYFGPTGIRFTPVFPFITMPAAPATAVGGVVLEWQYRTYSITAAMPLFLLLSVVGAVATLRRKAGRIGLMRIPLLTALAGAAGVVVWGYIAPRYIADFMPFLIIASCVGLVELWRRADRGNSKVRLSLLGVVMALGVYGMVANVASASTPTNEWSRTQTFHYVEMQKSVSDWTNNPIVSNIGRGSALPQWAPADKLFIVGSCRALYVSNGMDYSHNSPQQTYEHASWMAAQYGPGIVYDVLLTFHAPIEQLRAQTPILKLGPATIWMKPAGGSTVSLGMDDPHVHVTGPAEQLEPNFVYRLELDVDPYLRWLTMSAFGTKLLNAEWHNGPATPVPVPPTAGGYPYTVAVEQPALHTGLCRSLLHLSGGSPTSGAVSSTGTRAAPTHG